MNYTLFWCFFVVLYSVKTLAIPPVDPSKCRIYGPGIENFQFHMPVRYFFVELFDRQSQRINTSAGNAFLIVENLNQAACTIWSKVIDRQDGSYVVRYKLYNNCSRLELAITTPEGFQLAKSPYTLIGNMYPDECFCPQPMDKWLTNMECPKPYKHFKSSLEPWPKGSVKFQAVVDNAFKRFGVSPGAFSYCHYVILNNKIYRKCYGTHVGFKIFADKIFLSLARKVRLPDTQFLMNLGDWPLEVERGNGDKAIPIFSWCGSKNAKDIVLPTYELTEATLEMMGRQTLDMFYVESMSNVKWENKLEKAFWRGRDSSEERLKLVNISRQHPELLDARLTHFFFFRDKIDEYGPTAPVVTYEEFFKHKYQINLDGTVAAYRMPYLMASGNLILKQDSIYYEHFYPLLEPWKHYVPIKTDLSDLMDMLEWAKQNDADAHRIADNAKAFAREHLNPKGIFCYYVQMIKAYTERLASPPTKNILKNDQFEPVEQSDDAQACHCLRDAVAEPKKPTDKDEL